MAQKTVTKAVIAAAGFGTRFLPQTKAMPKEMLPIVDKPVIQYIVEELVAAGIKDIIIVSGYSKRSIEDHFDVPNEDLLNNLRAAGPKKAHYIDELNQIADLANFYYVRQKGPYGSATPLSNVAPLLKGEPFFYLYADDLIIARPNVFTQMATLYREFGGAILPCITVTDEADYDRYGIVSGMQIRPGVMKADSIIEKPGPKNPPSNLASVAGYLLPPEALRYVADVMKRATPGSELNVPDHILAPMLADGLACYGCEIANSRRYDTGDKLGYLTAVVDFALERDDVGPQLRAYLQKKLK